MKKLIVTCAAVACAVAFIGCGGADTETLSGEDDGEELSADEDLKDVDPGDGDDEEE